MTKPKSPPKTAVEKAAQRSTRQALAEERLAMTAIAKIVLLECPDPARVLARIDSMARAAEADRRIPPTTVQAIIDADRFLRRAIRREDAKPKPLFDPATPDPPAKRVDRLVNGSEGHTQLGLEAGGQESMLGDVETAHAERVDTLTKVHAAIVDLIRGNDEGMTDRELCAAYLRRYALRHDCPQQSPKAIKERRMELSGSGRLVPAGVSQTGEAAYDIVERSVVEAAS